MRRRVGYRMSDMTVETVLARVPRLLAFWVLAGIGLLVSHDLVYLVQTGPGEPLARALRGTSHEYWGGASLALIVLGVAVAAGTWLRLRSLRRRADDLGVTPVPTRRAGLLRTWVRLFVLIGIGFLIQENVEHYLSHHHAPGIGALLGVEYPLALPVIALISGVAALIATGVGGVERALVTVIDAALRLAFGHAPRAVPKPPLRLTIARISPLARSRADRAPPRSLLQQS